MIIETIAFYIYNNDIDYQVNVSNKYRNSKHFGVTISNVSELRDPQLEMLQMYIHVYVYTYIYIYIMKRKLKINTKKL